MLLKSLFLILIMVLGCSKGAKVKVGNSNSPTVTERGSLQALKSEQRKFNDAETKLLKTVCEVFETKRTHFIDTLIGKKFNFNLFYTNCNGISSQKLNVPMFLYVFNEEKLLYQLDRGPYQNLQYFPEEETDQRGLMEEFCTKTASLKQVFNITFDGADNASRVAVESVPPNNIKVKFEELKREKNSDYYKLVGSNELHIITNKARGDDLVGMVLEQTAKKSCSGTTKIDELKSVFINLNIE